VAGPKLTQLQQALRLRDVAARDIQLIADARIATADIEVEPRDNAPADERVHIQARFRGSVEELIERRRSEQLTPGLRHLGVDEGAKIPARLLECDGD